MVAARALVRYRRDRFSNHRDEAPMTISVGDKLPEATFKTMTADGAKPITTAEIFSGKKVVLFGVPGAFADMQQQPSARLPGKP